MGDTQGCLGSMKLTQGHPLSPSCGPWARKVFIRLLKNIYGMPNICQMLFKVLRKIIEQNKQNSSLGAYILWGEAASKQLACQVGVRLVQKNPAGWGERGMKCLLPVKEIPDFFPFFLNWFKTIYISPWRHSVTTMLNKIFILKINHHTWHHLTQE